MSIQADAAGFIAAYPEGSGETAGDGISGASRKRKLTAGFIRDLVGALEKAWFDRSFKVFMLQQFPNGAGKNGYRLACDAAMSSPHSLRLRPLHPEIW